MRVLVLMFVLAGGVLAPAGPARADGVLEINQLCVASGCFDGDSPGFPVEITRPGSYRLTGNLDITGESNPENVTVIRIEAGGSRSTLDLNGFSIIGATRCSGVPVTSCTPAIGSGSGSGVFVDNGVAATVRNGSIIGMGRSGVDCVSNSSCTLKNLIVEQSGLTGIELRNGRRVQDVTTRLNGIDGMSLGGLIGEVKNVIAFGNGANGIDVVRSSIVDSSAKENGFDGIATGGPVSRSISVENGRDGLLCDSGCIATGNVLYSNG
jgi:hypothetical protein